jgi:hypothetical protein
MCMCALECVCVCARSRYDGWDNMNRMDIREKFQQMTPEKIKFARKGFTKVIFANARFCHRQRLALLRAVEPAAAQC